MTTTKHKKNEKARDGEGGAQRRGTTRPGARGPRAQRREQAEGARARAHVRQAQGRGVVPPKACALCRPVVKNWSLQPYLKITA